MSSPTRKPVFAYDQSADQWFCGHCLHFITPIKLATDVVLHCGNCRLVQHIGYYEYKRTVETGVMPNDAKH